MGVSKTIAKKIAATFSSMAFVDAARRRRLLQLPPEQILTEELKAGPFFQDNLS